MIDVKLIKKPKDGNNGTTYVGGVYGRGSATEEARHALKADRANYAEQAEYANRAGYASRSAFADIANDLAEDSPVFERFLSRLEDDVAAGNITFQQAIYVLGVAVFKGDAQFGTFVKSLYAARLPGAAGQAGLCGRL